MDERVRLSRGSAEGQTAQSQPTIGTPCEVPVPRNVMVSGRPTSASSSLASHPGEFYVKRAWV